MRVTRSHGGPLLSLTVATMAMAASIAACSSDSDGDGAATSASSATTAPLVIDDSTTPATDEETTTTRAAATTTVGATTTTVATTTTTAAPDETTTTNETTTTIDPTADTRPVETRDETLAATAVLGEDNFRDGWTLYAAGARAKIDPASCAYEADGAITETANGALQLGPTMELDAAGAYVSSYAAVFPDADTATSYINLIDTDEWATCKLQELQTFQASSRSGLTVTLATRDDPALGEAGFESYAQFALATSTDELRRVALYSYYRLDRVVLIVSQEYGALATAQFDQMRDDTQLALIAAYDRIFEILSVGG